MKEKSMTKNHGGGIIGGTIIEKRSLRRNHWKENHREEIIEVRSIWEASGRQGILEASGRHLGGIWDSRRPWSSRRLRITKIDALSAKMQHFN